MPVQPPDDVPLQRLDLAALHRWAVLARAGLGAHQEQIDALNVFPVPDNDTGTNMFETVNAAVEAMLAASRAPDDTHPAASLSEAVGAFSRATMLGARGNSGVIMSQLVLGLVHATQEAEQVDGRVFADALDRASRLAYDAVGEPEEGTILTVVREAAGAATATVHGGDERLCAVVEAAVTAARESLGATTEQLGALSAAGVVDAGAAGFVVVMEALLHVVTGEAGPVRTSRLDLLPDAHDAAASATARPLSSCHGHESGYAGPRFEVMAVIEAGAQEGVALRQRLRDLGESVVVVGADGVWRVHVHTDDLALVQATLDEAGWLADVAVTDLRPADRTALRLVVLTAGPGLAALVADAGARAVMATGDATADARRLQAAALASGVSSPSGAASDDDGPGAIVLPCDLAVLDAVARLNPPLPYVVPATSAVAGLAAVAVFDAGGDPREVSAAMAAAAGAVRVVRLPAIPEPGELATALAPALATADAELVTVLLGADVDEDAVAAAIGPLDGVEVSYVPGALAGGQLEVGVE